MQRSTSFVLAPVVASRDNPAVQGLQMRLSPYQLPGNVPVVALHGIVSRPLPGAQGVVLMRDGDPSNAVCIGHNDPRHFMAGLPDGTVGIAHHLGAHVLLFDDRIEVDGGGKPVLVKNSSLTTIQGDVRIEGQLDVTGEVTAKVGGASVTLSQHRGHDGGGQPPTPNT